MKKAVISAITIMILLVGCGAPGGEYIGKWVNVKSSKNTMKIERNDDNFVIRITERSVRSGKLETENMPATFKDGLLQIQRGSFGPITAMIDKKTGNLIIGGEEYKRVD